ncbi:MAG: MBL fold metallo-hydrolase [Candidatus Micrarchaeia archaeon]|jgi:competence protein ComEC
MASGKRNLLFLISSIIVIVSAIAITFFQSPSPQSNPVPEGCGQLKIYIINVSQADSILIKTPQNKTILIDAGSRMKPNSSTNAVAFLRTLNISRIDYLIASHYHEDHIGGMPAIFNSFEIGKVYDNGNCGNYSSGVQRDFQLYASRNEFIHIAQDTSLQIDSCLAESKIIAPYAAPGKCFNSRSDSSNENENSILLRIVYGNTSFLFTGDCEENCEEELIQKGENIHSDFLKVGHHGSATSSSVPFLSAVSASIYAISTDKFRSVTDGYFHPRQIPLGNIYARGINQDNFFRTDLNGNIEIISDGTAITASSDAPAPLCELFSGYSSANVSSYAPIPALAGRCN